MSYSNGIRNERISSLGDASLSIVNKTDTQKSLHTSLWIQCFFHHLLITLLYFLLMFWAHEWMGPYWLVHNLRPFSCKLIDYQVNLGSSLNENIHLNRGGGPVLVLGSPNRSQFSHGTGVCASLRLCPENGVHNTVVVVQRFECQPGRKGSGELSPWFKRISISALWFWVHENLLGIGCPCDVGGTRKLTQDWVS